MVLAAASMVAFGCVGVVAISAELSRGVAARDGASAFDSDARQVETAEATTVAQTARSGTLGTTPTTGLKPPRAN